MAMTKPMEMMGRRMMMCGDGGGDKDCAWEWEDDTPQCIPSTGRHGMFLPPLQHLMHISSQLTEIRVFEFIPSSFDGTVSFIILSHSSPLY